MSEKVLGIDVHDDGATDVACLECGFAMRLFRDWDSVRVRLCPSCGVEFMFVQFGDGRCRRRNGVTV